MGDFNYGVFLSITLALMRVNYNINLALETILYNLHVFSKEVNYLLHFLEMHKYSVRCFTDMKIDMILTKPKEGSKTHVKTSITFLQNKVQI